MTCLLSSQGLVLATAMVVSSTVLLLTLSKQFTVRHEPKNHNSDSQSQNLRPCLCSGNTRGTDGGKRKKKRVKFAENVKDTKGNGEEYRREKRIAIMMANYNKEKENNDLRRQGLIGKNTCRVGGMPANRIALYNGILRDRVHRLECSH